MNDEDDGFDSMTRSGDSIFHRWYLANFDMEEVDIDHYEDCDQAWTAGQDALKTDPT